MSCERAQLPARRTNFALARRPSVRVARARSRSRIYRVARISSQARQLAELCCLSRPAIARLCLVKWPRFAAAGHQKLAGRPAVKPKATTTNKRVATPAGQVSAWSNWLAGWPGKRRLGSRASPASRVSGDTIAQPADLPQDIAPKLARSLV